ncbi:MAG: hydroxyisourate hydrolase [Rikenellaceae bacterium]|nr:hydroxyisourate hydrolase [Rikenellaceae bacterium]
MKKLIIVILTSLLNTGVFAEESGNYQLSTHILDISEGAPAENVIVSLYKYDFENLDWELVDKALTGKNGRVGEFLPYGQKNYGAYKLRFETEEYFKSRNLHSIYPYIEVAFKIEDTVHYHIPITVSANGYSTYRGN